MAQDGRDLQRQQGVRCTWYVVSSCLPLAFALVNFFLRPSPHSPSHSLNSISTTPVACSSTTVGVPLEHLQGGKLAIYELMAEESAVNYWEKYGNVSGDFSCFLFFLLPSQSRN